MGMNLGLENKCTREAEVSPFSTGYIALVLHFKQASIQYSMTDMSQNLATHSSSRNCTYFALFGNRIQHILISCTVSVKKPC